MMAKQQRCPACSADLSAVDNDGVGVAQHVILYPYGQEVVCLDCDGMAGSETVTYCQDCGDRAAAQRQRQVAAHVHRPEVLHRRGVQAAARRSRAASVPAADPQLVDLLRRLVR